MAHNHEFCCAWTHLNLTTTWILISPFSPFFPLVELETAFFPFFGGLPACPFVETSLLLEAVELAGRLDPDGTLEGGGIARVAEDAVRDTDGCRIPDAVDAVVVVRLDIEVE